MTDSKIIKNENTKSGGKHNHIQNMGSDITPGPPRMKKTPEIAFSDRGKIALQSAASNLLSKKKDHFVKT